MDNETSDPSDLPSAKSQTPKKLPKPLSRWQKRSVILEQIDIESNGLELGPSIAPLFRKSEGHNVMYLESTDSDALRERTERQGKDAKLVEEIDFILDRNLSLSENVNNHKFGWVTSSHVVEHIPDFISHLTDIESVLNTGGVYAMIIPDRNYCFDCLKPPTSLGQVIQAHVSDTRLKRVANMVDEWRYGARPRGHEMGGWSLQTNMPPLKAKYTDWKAKVHDVLRSPEEAVGEWFGHQWFFDPIVFSDIIADLTDLGLIRFELVHLQATYNMDFIAVLKKVSNPQSKHARQFGKDVSQSYLIPQY